MPSNDPEYHKRYIRQHYLDNKEYYKRKNRERRRLERLRRKEFFRRYKTLHGCKDCGYNLHPEAIDFDHLPQYTKDFNISQAAANMVSWARVKDEIRKCELRCANCHRVKTAQRRNVKSS